MTKQEILHKELDLIQAVISRMANNSFLLKGWIISIVVVLLALTRDNLLSASDSWLGLIFGFPVLVFWYLDAFFLHKERCYRKLYDWVIQNRMTTDEHMYSLNYTRFQKDVASELKIMFSKTLWPFYLLSLAMIVFFSVRKFLGI